MTHHVLPHLTITSAKRVNDKSHSAQNQRQSYTTGIITTKLIRVLFEMHFLSNIFKVIITTQIGNWLTYLRAFDMIWCDALYQWYKI